MPRIETIKASEAPAAAKKMSKASEEIVSAINRLKMDEVLRPQPDPVKSMRGLKTSVGRIVSCNGLKIESSTDNAQDCLYLRQAR